ncbi:MAG: hypothetical protein R2764_09350 [Bacteroidales bacterium]
MDKSLFYYTFVQHEVFERMIQLIEINFCVSFVLFNIQLLTTSYRRAGQTNIYEEKLLIQEAFDGFVVNFGFYFGIFD